MSPEPPAVPRRPSPFAATNGLPLVVASLVGLAAVVALLPYLGDETVSFAEQVLSYALAALPSGALFTAYSPSSTRACAAHRAYSYSARS